MAEAKKQLKGPELFEFLGKVGIARVAAVGKTSASGEDLDDAGWKILDEQGDRVAPTMGIVAEDPLTVMRLFEENTAEICFGLTPDGHLTCHTPRAFNATRAAQQVIEVAEADMTDQFREEALAATWLSLAYHDADHPADLGGLLFDASGRERCCFVDVKLTQAKIPDQQRTKLERRAGERKLGLMAQTVTSVCEGGFRGYPGFGQPGLVATLLSNPAQEGRTQAGYSINWFFRLSSNYQATQATWGWGGPLGVKLPDSLCEILRKRSIQLGRKRVNFLGLLSEFGNYTQFRDSDGAWDRPRLEATLTAKAIAARYLLMHENTVENAQISATNIQPPGVTTPVELEQFWPGDSLAAYYGRKCDEKARECDEKTQEIQRSVERRRLRGHKDEEIAEDLGISLADLLRRFPRS